MSPNRAHTGGPASAKVYAGKAASISTGATSVCGAVRRMMTLAAAAVWQRMKFGSTYSLLIDPALAGGHVRGRRSPLRQLAHHRR
jgi:hypothetical protein